MVLLPSFPPTALLLYTAALLLLITCNTAVVAFGAPRSTLRSWGAATASSGGWVHTIPRGGSDGGSGSSSDASGSGSGSRSSSSSSSSSYTADLDSVKSLVLSTVIEQVEGLRRQIVEAGESVESFGATADQICNQALEQFATAAPAATSPASSAAFDTKLSELEAAVDAPLHVLYLKLLGTFRESALQRYRADGTTYAAMVSADAEFVRLASAATRDGADDWDWSQERSFLQSVMSLAADAGQKATDVQLNAATSQQTAMAFLQSQQQMIQQLQSQLYGQTSPWNAGVAYRIPDTNFNLNGSYQQGRANVQLSCVPDEYAPFLGPNGFTNGVGPGNLGLSLNLSM